MSKTVAEVLVETLIAAGVKRIYGLCGDSLNGLTDAISHHKKEIEWVQVRHEETAAFAAGAEAHLTGSLAVCAGSSGPGNLHLINGLYDCYRNRVPVLAIAAHVPSVEIGGTYFQETHPEQIFRECSHYCELVSNVEQMPRALEIAMQTAVSLRGVSVLILPGDIGLKTAIEEHHPAKLHSDLSNMRPADIKLQEVAEILNKAKNVTILGGAGCINSHDILVEIAQKLGAPIVHTLRGKEYIEYNNPSDVGMTGLLGFSSGYYAMKKCDVLFIIGADFPYRQFLPQDCKIIQLDCRAENIGKRTHVDVGLVGHTKETLEALIPKIEAKTHKTHLEDSVKHYKEARKDLDHYATKDPGKKSIHPEHVARVIDQLASDDAIFTCDVGTPTIWSARYLTMNGKRRLLGSFNHGSMANSIPQAIGAQKTFPNRQVITLSGDGGLSMVMGELLTLIQIGAPVKVVVFNNSCYGFVELEMKANGILEFGTDLKNPNFAKMADAIGMLGVRIESSQDLEAGIKKALEHKGPVLVDVIVNRQELAIPPTIKMEQVKGFNIYLAKAILNGRGTEILDLIKTNLPF